jgi:putative ABC transport system permease protein
MRAALSALGISLGIATMLIVTGIPASSQAALQDQITALGTNMLQAQPQPNQTPPVLLPLSASAMVRRIGPVTQASSVANTGVSIQRTQWTNANLSVGIAVLASQDNLLAAINGSLYNGSFLSAATDRFPTVVLGSQAASWLGISTLRAGQPAPQVFIDNQWFTVIGILNPTPLTPEIEQAVLVGWPAAEHYLNFNGHPTVVYLKAQQAELNSVRGVLPATLYPQLPGLVTVSQPSPALAAQQDSEHTFSGLILGLAAIAVLVGAIGVANTMIISVLERRREIGLRRALGAHRGQIRIQFLTEAVFLSFLGGLAGTVVGTTAAVLYAFAQGWPPVIPLASVAEGIGGALVAGVAAGVYPALRAARLTPTEALAST